jgi:hypothetical protein
MTNHLAPWMLLPAEQGKCPECGVAHSPDMPHDNRSLFYQYHFYKQNGRWPTWDDAMAHCSDEVKAATKEVISKNRLWIHKKR